MISVDEAQARLLALASPLPPVELEIAETAGHYLHAPLNARRTQPAADLSAMDGYAVAKSHHAGSWRVVGESSAGCAFPGVLEVGEAVRIFTGAIIPGNAERVIIQEDAQLEGDLVKASDATILSTGLNIRQAGTDFNEGDEILAAGTCLQAGQIALAAMAGHGTATVGRWPRIAIVATGDELIDAGLPCRIDQIPCSNSPMLRAMLSTLPCKVTDAGILRDDLSSLKDGLVNLTHHADIIVTTGGASVGDHDLVQAALLDIGAEMDFWRVAMRPGKPLMAGKVGSKIVLGLPGNPSSAFVTAFLFLLPLIRHLAGCRKPFPEMRDASTTTDLPKNGIRAEYLRAIVDGGDITPITSQDSGLTRTLSLANALLVQEVHQQQRQKGSIVQYMSLT